MATDSLELLLTFCEVARRCNFSAAARARGVSPATVSKAIARLEERFGVRLFQRTTRKVSLTDAGRLLYERSAALLELIELTEDELHQRATQPSGRLQLTAPHSLMHTELPLMLARFMQRHPAVSMDLHVTDRTIGLAEEGVDLALRAGPIPDANIIVRRLVRLEYVAAATPAYWERRGMPTHPEELRDHAQLAYHLPGQTPSWHFSVDGQRFELPLTPVFASTNHAPLTVLALQGMGVVWRARQQLVGPIARGELVPALGAFSPADEWLYAAYLERRHNSAALRALLDALQEFADEARAAR